MTNYRVRIGDHDAFDEWRKAAARDASGDAFREALKAHMAETGEVPLCWQGSGPSGFLWMCPGCGGTFGGRLGDQPVGGWDAPRWVNTKTLERPTLSPSLGCPSWRDGHCTGHWWLRDGELVPA